ncbi:MAG TPA: putative cobaltochelatase [Streptosporangiaceae bacterium]
MTASDVTSGDHRQAGPGAAAGAAGAGPAPLYPFAAIVGMADLKLALLLNAVSPAIGGVLVRGEKGTAKSTVVRGLGALLPPVRVVTGCRFSCDPADPDPGCPDGPHPPGAPERSRPATLAELPVGATEDRLAGSLDIERALSEGVTAYEPGVLAAAHRGLLYVDEVNLLHDHLVDLLLDAAALGVSYVEREGVSIRHAARFLLVGTMNPEEGELRPQLLDRFGLTVEVAASRDPDERAEVVRRRLAFEADPAGFARRFDADSRALAEAVAAARERLPRVVLPDAALRQICAVCGRFGVDGMRADLVTARAAIALAAWHGRAEVGIDDIRQAARLALPHRRRRDPFDAPGLDEQELEDALREPPPDPPEPPEPPDPDPGSDSGPDSGPDGPSGPDSPGPQPPGGQQDQGSAPDQAPEPSPGPAQPPAGDQNAGPAPADDDDDRRSHPPVSGERRGDTAPSAPPFRTRLLTVPGMGAGALGRRSAAYTPQGRSVGARPPAGRVTSVHLPATLRAAAPAQPDRRRRTGQTGPGLILAGGDLREAVHVGREGNLVLFAVDASGSMAARQRMRAAKGAVLSLLLDAYQRRDKVGLVTFRGDGAELVLPPTSSVEAGARRLDTLATGGRTPLAAGLAKAAGVLAAEKLRDPARRPLLVVVTDGRATRGTGADLARATARLAGTAAVVVDCETGLVRLGLAAELAARLGAALVGLDELPAGAASAGGGGPLAGVVRAARGLAGPGRAA